MKNLTPDMTDSLLKLVIGTTFCITVMFMVLLSLYSVIFVTQPMTGMAPADKQFFLLLSDMSKYILGSLATLLAIKGKDGVAKLVEPPPGVSSPKDWQDEPKPKAPPPATSAPAPSPVVRTEPTLEAAPVLFKSSPTISPQTFCVKHLSLLIPTSPWTPFSPPS